MDLQCIQLRSYCYLNNPTPSAKQALFDIYKIGPTYKNRTTFQSRDEFTISKQSDKCKKNRVSNLQVKRLAFRSI